MKLDVLCKRSLPRNYTSKWVRRERKKTFETNSRAKNIFFCGMFVIIMVVTFLIEFRLPNFSPTVSRTERDWKLFSVNEKWLIVFHFDFSLHSRVFLGNSEKKKEKLWKFELEATSIEFKCLGSFSTLICAKKPGLLIINVRDWTKSCDNVLLANYKVRFD